MLFIRTWFTMGMRYELKLETLTQDQKNLLGIKLSHIPTMTLYYLGKHIRKIETDYFWNLPVVLANLVECALLGCKAFIFSLWDVRQLHSHIKMVTPKHLSFTCVSPVKPKRETLWPPPRPIDHYHPQRSPPSCILANPSSPYIQENLQSYMP